MENNDSNSPNSPNQTPEAGTARHLPTRVRRRGRRLTIQDAREIASLCALRASEAEACAALGIPISSWHHWKARAKNTEDYNEMMNALRGAKIKAHFDNVEAFSVKDWRASIAYLEKVMPARYSSAAERVSVEVNVNQMPHTEYLRTVTRAFEIMAGQNPEWVAKGIADEVRLRRRDPKTLKWISSCGYTPPDTDDISPAIRERVKAMLEASTAIVDVTAEPRQLQDAETVAQSPAPDSVQFVGPKLKPVKVPKLTFTAPVATVDNREL